MSQAHPTIRPQPGIMGISPYVGGASTAPGYNGPVIKLSSNENPYGLSDKARAAYVAAAEKLHRYPSSTHDELREAIGEVHGMDPARIICGAGSDEIIAFLCQAYAGPGDEVLHTEHGFSIYKIDARANGAEPIAAPETAMTTDVDALLAACTERTKLVFIANPNNPTGTMIGPEEVARLADNLPPQALLVLDGAYAEYVRAPGYDGGLSLVESRENVVMTRTFSKIYGMGGLRLGWGYMPAHVADVLDRVRGPFNLTGPTIAAGIAAVRDQEFVARCATLNEVWRGWLAGRLAELGIRTLESHANFLLAEFGQDRVAAADDFFKSRGLILRRVDSYGLPGWIRITVGDEDACRRIVEAAAAFTEAPR